MNFGDSDSDDELPPGWEERVTVDGNVYYANHLTKNTQWTHPRTGKKKKVSGSLPFGWERVVTPAGEIIYVNHENERTTYTDPRLAFAVEEKEHVNDFRQRFDASSTALQVLHGRDLSGKIAIVTGANAGIGFETARSLAKHGCTVVFACRNLSAAEEAIDKIRSEERLNIADNCIAIHLDLSSLPSVVQFVNTIKSRYHQIDILVLNAGVFGLPFTKTLDGFEMMFQVNYLSNFYLTLLLEPLFGVSSRIVIVSSESHRFSNLKVDNLNPLTLSPDTSRHYWDMTAYNNSKLCVVLFGRQLAKYLQSRGISVFSLHPGNMVSSGLSRHWWLYRFIFAFVRPFTKSLQQAAATSVYCATAQELVGLTGHAGPVEKLAFHSPLLLAGRAGLAYRFSAFWLRSKCITIIDFCIPFENGLDALQRARQLKIDKYAPLRAELEAQGKEVFLDAFIIGALGTWDQGNEAVLRQCRISRKYASLMRKLMCSDAIKWSRDIYVEHVTGTRQYQQ